MKKIYFILIIIFILFIIGLFGYNSIVMIRPGTASHFSVEEGCDVIKKNAFVNKSLELEVNFSKEMVDEIQIKAGFGNPKKKSITKYCTINKSIDMDCAISYFDMVKTRCLEYEEVYNYLN